MGQALARTSRRLSSWASTAAKLPLRTVAAVPITPIRPLRVAAAAARAVAPTTPV